MQNSTKQNNVKPKKLKNTHILILAEMVGYGGMTTQIAEMSRLLASDGYTVSLLTITTHPNNRDIKNRLPAIRNIFYVRVPGYDGVVNKLRILMYTYVNLFKITAKHRIDFVWCIGPLETASFLCTPLSLTKHKLLQFLSPLDLELRLNFPRKNTGRNWMYNTKNFIYYYIIKLSLLRFKTIFTLSRFACNLLIDRYNISPGRIQLTPGFLSDKIIPKISQSDKVRLRKKLGLSTEHIIFLLPSRFEPWKNPEIIIQTAAYLKNDNVRFIFSGLLQQDHFLKWMLWAINHKCLQYLYFFPHNSNKQIISELYTASDCVIFPAHNIETFGYVALEAISHGVAVISSNAGALTEMLTPIDNRLISTENTASSYAKIITMFASMNPKQRKELSLNSLRMAKNYNNPETKSQILKKVNAVLQ